MTVECYGCGGAVRTLAKLDVGVDGRTWSVDFCDECRRKLARKLHEVCDVGDNRRPECRRGAHCPHCLDFRQGEAIDALMLQELIGPRPLDGDLEPTERER